MFRSNFSLITIVTLCFLLPFCFKYVRVSESLSLPSVNSDLLVRLLSNSQIQEVSLINSTLNSEMPAFKHTKVKLNFDDFCKLATEKFGIDPINIDNGNYYFTVVGREYFLEYSRDSGRIEYALVRTAYPGDNSWRSKRDFPSEQKCKKVANDILEKFNLSFSGIYFSNIYDTTKDGDCYLEYNYYRKINGCECPGPGNLVSFRFDGEGNMASLRYNWQNLEEFGMRKVIPPKEAFERMKKGSGILFSADQTSVIGNLIKVELIYPMTGREKSDIFFPKFLMYFENLTPGKHLPEYIYGYAPAIAED